MIVEKLGPIKKLDIHLGNETILLGRNNTGKTYISYLLYGVFKKVSNIKSDIIYKYLVSNYNSSSDLKIEFSKQEFFDFVLKEIIEDLNSNIYEDMTRIFNLSGSDFKDTKIEIFEKDLEFLFKKAQEKNINGEKTRHSFATRLVGTVCVYENENKSKWIINLKNIENVNVFGDKDIISPNIMDLQDKKIIDFFLKSVTSVFATEVLVIPNVLYIPAERNGINVFRNELTTMRSSGTFDIEKNEAVVTYPMPIADYMKYLNVINIDIDENLFENHRDEKRLEVWTEFAEDILQGKYEYDEELNEYYYREIHSINSEGKHSYKRNKIPLQIASSSIKSLFGLEYYLKYRFKSGDILFIDEPEMNLDPENQVKMAKILVKLAKYDVKVIISTHSDYLTRATTNAILEDKLCSNGMFNDFTYGYYFDKSNVKPLGLLTEIDYISNFDDMNLFLEDTYLALLNKLDDNKSKEE